MMLYQKPQLQTRVKSTMIDTLVYIFMLIVLVEAFEVFPNVSDWVRGFFFFLTMLYDPIFTSTSRTLGQWLMNLRVVDYNALKFEDRVKRINFFLALFRVIFKGLLGVASFFTIHTNEDKRAIHDYISGSVVIEGKPEFVEEPQPEIASV